MPRSLPPAWCLQAKGQGPDMCPGPAHLIFLYAFRSMRGPTMAQPQVEIIFQQLSRTIPVAVAQRLDQCRAVDQHRAHLLHDPLPDRLVLVRREHHNRAQHFAALISVRMPQTQVSQPATVYRAGLTVQQKRLERWDIGVAHGFPPRKRLLGQADIGWMGTEHAGSRAQQIYLIVRGRLLLDPDRVQQLNNAGAERAGIAHIGRRRRG